MPGTERTYHDAKSVFIEEERLRKKTYYRERTTGGVKWGDLYYRRKEFGSTV